MRSGVGPNLRQSYNEVGAERKRQQNELEDSIRTAEEAKATVAQMELEDGDMEKDLDESHRYLPNSTIDKCRPRGDEKHPIQ